MENGNRPSPFTRVGSQVQSLHRPPDFKAFRGLSPDDLRTGTQGHALVGGANLAQSVPGAFTDDALRLAIAREAMRQQGFLKADGSVDRNKLNRAEREAADEIARLG